MTTCPSCQHINAEGINFCDECGTNLTLKPQAASIESSIQRSGNTQPAPSAKLVITRGGTMGKEFHVEPIEDTFIGRWDPDGGAFPEIDLTQDDPEAKISRKHARITIKNGGYLLEDIGSLNGTYINRGPRLVPGSPHSLQTGDEVVMGRTFFRFVQSEQSE